MVKITCTFDSNVWENLVDEKKRITDPVCGSIYKFIEEGNIQPFFCEVIATLEALPRKQRREYLIEKLGDNVELTNYLKTNIPLAIKLGFKFIRTPRMSMPKVQLDKYKDYLAPDIIYPQAERQARTIKCGRYIQSLGSGKAQIDGDEPQAGDGHKLQRSAKVKSVKKVADAVGEWADGDALAAHYGYGIDDFLY